MPSGYKNTVFSFVYPAIFVVTPSSFSPHGNLLHILLHILDINMISLHWFIYPTGGWSRQGRTQNQSIRSATPKPRESLASNAQRSLSTKVGKTRNLADQVWIISRLSGDTTYLYQQKCKIKRCRWTSRELKLKKVSKVGPWQ